MQAFAQETDRAEGAEQAAQQIDISPKGILKTIDSWIDGFFLILPNLVVAAALLLIFYGLAWLAERLVNRWASRRGRENLGEVLGGFVKAAIIVLGALLAITVVLPTLTPGDLVAGLGIGSVAIGFAFKDILQNWLAGLLILLRRPFRPGDQIIVKGYEGTVDHIETRVTAIRTYDGRMALIPNSVVYTEAVLINTAFAKRRSQYDVGIGYGDSVDEAKAAILTALKSVDGVEDDPEPEVLVVDLAASWVTLRPRWWTDSRRTDLVHVESRVIEAIKAKLDEKGIDMPFETVVQLFHDQTEEVDGIRGNQREGWPKPAGDGTPRSRLELTWESGDDTAPARSQKKPRRRSSKSAS